MAKRYENSNIKKNIVSRGISSKQIYSITGYATTIYSSIPESDSDIYVITQDGDRLDLIANQFYGNSTLWWYIAKANHLSFMTLEPGMRLRIPATTKYATII